MAIHGFRYALPASQSKLISLLDLPIQTEHQGKSQSQGKPIPSLTLADFFNAPSVDDVNLSDYSGKVSDSILVLADDDFLVQEVKFEVMDESGILREKRCSNPGRCRFGSLAYTATRDIAPSTIVTINVVVLDRPGGSDTKNMGKRI